jgi:iron complex outermembrane receptor protein
MLSEAHVEEEEAHGDEEHEDEHGHGAPTIFTNEAQEYGAIFDISTDTFTQKIALEFVSEDVAITGAEAFMNPASTDEVTLGYYASREFGGFVFDFGIRNDWVDRKGSVSEDHHDEEHGDDHDEEHGDDHDEEHADEEAELQYFDTEESVTSYGLQISRAMSDQFSATLNLASVERAPAAVELFMNGPHLAVGRYEEGNPNLQTEESKSAELSLNYSSETFFGSFSVYTNDIDNYIYLLDDPDEMREGFISANYLQQDAEFTGYEFEIGGVFPIASGDLTLSYGLDSVSADFANNTNVPRISPDRSIYTAAFSRGRLGASITLKEIEAQSDTAFNEEMTAGYTMLNMNVTNVFALTNDIDLTVSVFGRNLMDEIARNHSSFVKEEVPLPGRSYGLKFYATF